MLPPGSRLRRPAEFSAAIRGGARGRAGTLVVHLSSPTHEATNGPRVGLVVPKTVGNAVIRNQVKRRLRAQAAQRLVDLRDGELLVLRALPGCGATSSEELGRSFEAGLAQARRRTGRKVAQR